jgi:acetyl esterase/lipase
MAGMTLYPQARASIDGQVKVPLSVDRRDESRRSIVDAVALEVGAGPELASVLDVDAAGVGARLYRPDTAGGAAVVVYLHGGGWVLVRQPHFVVLARRRGRLRAGNITYRRFMDA